MRVLVTGATGFIGRHLLPSLVARGDEVVGLVRRLPQPTVPGVHYVLQDLAQPLEWARLPQKLDAVIHQATIIDPGVKAEREQDASAFLVNVVGTWRLLTYANRAGAQIFVHASTGGVYGCGSRPFKEQDPHNPMDIYSLTKAQAELAVLASGYTVPDRSYATVVLRYFFPYGVGTPNPIPRYVAAAVRGETIALPEGGGPRFNPLHIDDAVTATIAALGLNTDAVLNIAGTEVTTFAEIAAYAAARAGRDLQTSVIPVDALIPYYRSHLVADIGHMQKQLGITPQVCLADGLAQLTDHYLA